MNEENDEKKLPKQIIFEIKIILWNTCKYLWIDILFIHLSI